jgi:hypothetical protein
MIPASIDLYLKSDLVVRKVRMLVGFNSPPFSDSVVVEVSFIFVIITDREAPQRQRWQT